MRHIGAVVMVTVAALLLATAMFAGGGQTSSLAPPAPTVDSSTSTTTPTSTTPSTTTTSTTTTSTTTAPATTSTSSVPVSPLPLAVEASTHVVGVGGVVAFTGACAIAAPGPVTVWVISTRTTVEATPLTDGTFRFEWTAPTNPDDIASYSFQFWCGDPTGFEDDYPPSHRPTVDMVAVAPASPTTTVAVATTAPTPVAIIPETN